MSSKSLIVLKLDDLGLEGKQVAQLNLVFNSLPINKLDLS
jgi:hypothetical protein